MTSILKTVLFAIAVIMFVDFFCFSLWIATNQKPVDDFYAGAITANILKAIIK